MKRLLTFLLIAMVVGPLPAIGQSSEWQQIPLPPLPAFHWKVPKRVVLPNGMILFLQEDHELPTIQATARIRGGSRSEPGSKVGMLDIYGEVWRTGGTKTQTGDQLDDFLEVRAAKVETNDNADSTTISLSCLKGDFDDVFKVFVSLMTQPEFRDDKIDIAKRENFDAISRRNDDVNDIAQRESAKLAYGANNPYTRIAEYATIGAVTRQDLLEWHRSHLYPNNIIFGIVGDFDSTTMEAELRQAFGVLPKGPAFKEPNVEFTPAAPGYYVIPKSDVNQSSIRMVELGVRRDNPDYFATRVFNEAFGGGFSSRLVRNIRTGRGLAYQIGGGIGSAFDHPGITRVSMGTKSASTVESIQAIYDEIDKLAKEPITEDEVKRAKDSILNSFVFNFDSPEKILQERMAYEFYGYPADFLERFQAAIEKVTTADVARIIPKYVQKNKLAVLVVGNTAEFDKPLNTLGAVKELDISIPPPPGENSAESENAPTSSNPEGKALAAKVAQALGGEAKLKTIKAMRAELSANQKTPQGDMPVTMQSTIVYPDHMYVLITGAMGSFNLITTPDAAFASRGDMVQDMPPSRKAESLAQIKRDLIYLTQHLDDPAFSFAAAGTEKIGDVNAAIVQVSGPGVSLRWFVDPKSGRILREAYQGLSASGTPAQNVVTFDDWRTTNDGLTLPFLRKSTSDGQDSSSAQFTSFQINPTVDAKLFAKPANPKPAQ